MPDPAPSSPADLTIFISAGEASGETYGAMLLAELQSRLRAQAPHFIGMGGPRMVAAGLHPIVRAEEMAVMGITEVVRHLPHIYREFRRLKHAIGTRRPALAILIDFPDIHFKLAQELRRLGIPVIFFVSPQLWAWKKHRIKLVQRYVDRMLVIFPFEEPFYRERGVDAEFVGHPLADLPLPTVSRQEFAARHALDPAKTWIALLPGSRAKEIRANLPTMLAAAHRLRATNPDLEFLIPLAPTLHVKHLAMVDQLVKDRPSGLTIRLLGEDSAEDVLGRAPRTAELLTLPTAGVARATLFHSRAAIVASGTATVEAALIGNPFVVVYRVSPLTYAIAKRVVSVPHVAMVNLIAGNRIVPELIQKDFTASNIVHELAALLPDGPPRQSMIQELQRVRALLTAVRGGSHTGAIDRVAASALAVLGIPSPVRQSVQS
ncbi:MAG TPA: lipid-A-disaccharide synthase [Terracidiphilus sp.]|nr:lipid-A-disaccharide synthase [Terracidiphilus sp.]